MKRFLTIIAGVLLATGAYAQVEVQDYDALRTNTWSFYGKGGVSTIFGGDLIENINPVFGTKIAPLAGVGIDYNIRPWVRIGLGYEFSQFKRDQRFNAVQADGLTYRHLDVLTHSADLTADFNLMELAGNRDCKKFNLYLGTGLGYMLNSGNDYTIKVGTNQNVTGSMAVFNYWLKAHNEHVKVNSLYIPLNLSAEYDFSPRFTAGIETGAKYLFAADQYLPRLTAYAGITLRFNLLGKKHGYTTKTALIGILGERIKSLTASNDACSKRSAALADENDNLKRDLNAAKDEIRRKDAEIDALKNKLAEIERRAKLDEAARLIAEAVVYFANDSYKITPEGQQTIDTVADFMERNPEFQLELVGSASKVGGSDHNLNLSRNRAHAVKDALLKAGVDEGQIVDPLQWIGDKGMTNDAKCRRVSFSFKSE